jgi:histone-lysine N-methyltransferase SETD3
VSRVFGFTLHGAETTALVPMADMFNHGHPVETSWAFDDDADAFTMTALRDFAPGDEVHDSYGRKCNGRFFLNYSFTLEDNQDDEAEVRASDGRLVSIGSGLDRDTTEEALGVFRLERATAREQRIAASHGDVVARALSLRNEAAALGALLRSCEAALSAFPTSVDEDDALLREGDLNVDLRNCVVQRRGEKRVLRACIDEAAAALPVLRLPWPTFARAARGRSGDSGVDRYLQHVLEALADPRRGPSHYPHEEAIV